MIDDQIEFSKLEPHHAMTIGVASYDNATALNYCSDLLR